MSARPAPTGAWMLLLLPIVGCASIPRAAPASSISGVSARYRCDDRRFVEVLYGGGGTVVLTIGGSTTDLERASSTEPNRYSGSGQEWLVSDPRTGTLTATGDDQKLRGTICKTN